MHDSIDVTATKKSIRNFFLQYSDDVGPVYPRLLEQAILFPSLFTFHLTPLFTCTFSGIFQAILLHQSRLHPFS